MHFKRTDSDFLQLLKSVWIYQTASCGNGICQHFKFYLKCSIPFGFHYGVAGVAAATVISRVLNLGLVICFGHYYIHAKEKKERLKNRVVFGQIVKIGLPSAMETALYNVAMTLIIRFLNQMDANGMNVTARSYAMQITNFLTA